MCCLRQPLEDHRTMAEDGSWSANFRQRVRALEDAERAYRDENIFHDSEGVDISRHGKGEARSSNVSKDNFVTKSDLSDAMGRFQSI
eukprot:7783256-Karenia_brevis.AAC.1